MSGKIGPSGIPGDQTVRCKIMGRCGYIEVLIDKIQGLTEDLCQRLSDALGPVGTTGISGMSGYSSPPSPLVERLDRIHYKAIVAEHQLKQLIERIDI